jgi:hypothetical protein
VNKFLKRFFERTSRWSIGVYAGDSPVRLTAPKGVKNPVLTWREVTDRRADFVADPFMIRKMDAWFMFFEVLVSKTQKAEIGLARSGDGFSWDYQGIVLTEPFHLSYPYVFQWKNDFYMLPESVAVHEVRLYKAVEFPHRWQFANTLLRGNYADASLFRAQDRWWMMATGEREGAIKSDNLRLFHAEELLAEWQEHPSSPVVCDNPRSARPGGRVIVLSDGRMIRFAQDDEKVYGHAVRAFEITRLSLTEYAEKQYSENPVLAPGDRHWNRSGMHTVDPHLLEDGRWLACVDGQYRYVRLRRDTP